MRPFATCPQSGRIATVAPAKISISSPRRPKTRSIHLNGSTQTVTISTATLAAAQTR